MEILVGTAKGLWQSRDATLVPVTELNRAITALTTKGREVWAISGDGALLHRTAAERWTEHASLTNHEATCLAATPNGLLIGTAEAHLLRLAAGKLDLVDSFDAVDGREAWYTPWGDPADVRSIAVALDGTIYVNVHVGGVVRSCDGGRSWTPTVDIDVDVHQVVAHPSFAEVVLIAAGKGFGISRDSGKTWQFITDHLHAHYARAVAVSDEMVLVSVSTGPGGQRAALYRKPLEGDTTFVRCTEGLPWFDHNIDTSCLAANGSLVAFGTADGRVFRSIDAGERWHLVTADVPKITSVTIG